jgi:serine protease Do
VDVRLSNGTIIQAKVVKTDKVNDLALLKAETSPSGWLPVSKGETELKLGQTVFTIGYPNAQVQGLEPKFTDGRISSASGIGDSKTSYQTTVPVQHGNSGGPLVDLQTGWVVGVINSRLEDMRSGAGIANVSYAIKGKVVCDFLESLPEAKAAVQSKPPPPLKKGDEQAVINRVRNAAILILQLR